MDFKVFELVIDPNDESGVSAIALVDEPAIERDFHKFKKEQHKERFQVKDEDKRIVSGFAMIADLPIPRVDDAGNLFYVVFRKPTIEAIVDKFMREGLNNSVNLMHDPNQTPDGIHVFESIVIDEDRGSFAPKGFNDAPDGSWFVSMKVENDEVWQAVKDGTFKGFSVEGMFGREEPTLKDEDIIEAAIEAIQGV